MAKDFFKEILTAKEVEEQGTWTDLPDFECSVKVARVGSNAYSVALQARLKKYRKQLQKPEDMQEHAREQVKSIMCGLYADFILLDWKNIEEAGQPIPVTRENKLRLLENDDFREAVIVAAQDRHTFLAKELEEDVEELKKPSSTNSSTASE